MVDLMKLIEIYINRKDKYKKAEDRSRRREMYFEEIAAIEKNQNLDPYQKRAMKNSAAQKLTGSGLATYEFVDYYYRHPEFINFEILSPMVAFWDQTLIKTYDNEKRIIKLEFNKFEYRKERFFSFFSWIILLGVLIFFAFQGNAIINFISSNYYINNNIIGMAYLILMLGLVGLTLFFGFLFLTLLDLKRLVK